MAYHWGYCDRLTQHPVDVVHGNPAVSADIGYGLATPTHRSADCRSRGIVGAQSDEPEAVVTAARPKSAVIPRRFAPDIRERLDGLGRRAAEAAELARRDVS